MAINTNINIPYSQFLDVSTGRPSQEWLLWLMNPKVITLDLGNALGVSSGGTGLSQIPTNGQLLIGNGSGYTLSKLTEGNNVSITNGPGSIKISADVFGPQASDISGDLQNVLYQSQLNGPSQPQLGTLASQNADNVRLIGFSINPSPAVPNPAPNGTLYWDGGSTLGLQMSQNVLARIGQSEFIYVKASSAITKGQLVYHTGAVGGSGVLTVAPSLINLTDSTQLVGVAAESIPLNGFGFIQVTGTLRGFNTTGSSVGETWSDGDPLYYNPSYVGSFTKVKPSAPSIKSYVGEVVNASSGGSGSINIKFIYGSELGGTDSNVQFSSITNGNIIQYDGIAGYWKNIATLPTTSGGTGLTSFTANGIVYASSTSALTTGSNLLFDGTNFGIGITPTASIHLYSATSATQLIQGDSTVNSTVQRSITGSGGPSIIMRKTRGTVASPSAVTTGDLLGQISFAAFGGSNNRTIASIRGYVDTYVSDTNISGTLIFDTSPAGSAASAEKMRITSAGNIYGVSGTTSMTDGFFYIPSAAGAPSGTPTAVSGHVPMYYDTTNNKFYVYNSAWKGVTLT